MDSVVPIFISQTTSQEMLDCCSAADEFLPALEYYHGASILHFPSLKNTKIYSKKMSILFGAS